MENNTNKDEWTSRWDTRYGQPEFAYGEEPNLYLKETLGRLPVGNILFPAEGEGRNAVFAARMGWKVSAFDISEEGRNKAMKLAEKNEVEVEYKIGELNNLHYQPDQFDVIALIYAHFPASIKSGYHHQLNGLLKKGGMIIFEAFSKRHLEYLAKNENVGGPKDIGSLFSIEELRNDFPGYEVLELVEKEVELHEGKYHNGVGSVIRFTGRKK